MSEFSESYHLKSKNLNDAVELMKKSSCRGYVSKSCDDWSVLIPESAICNYSYNKKLIKKNTGILLQYIYPEDHGFCFRVFQGKRMVSEYLCDINNAIEDDIRSGINIEKLNSADLIRLMEINISEIELLKLLQPTTFDEYISMSYEFMELLGIPPEAYGWISYHYCELNQEDNPEIAKQFIKI